MKIKVLILGLIIFGFSGCASGKSIFGSLFGIKAADNIEGTAAAQVGVGNKTNKIDTKVGGNLSNDSEVMKTYIESVEKGHKVLLKTITKMHSKVINIFYAIILGLLGLLVRFIIKDAKVTKRLLDARDREDKHDVEMLKNALREKKNG